MEPEILKAAMSFVPRQLAQRLRDDSGALFQGSQEDFDAAILFGDLSGFTALTERLANRGRSGAEDITQILNDYFGRLIGIIHAHGGDVIKFAGDALYAIWRCEGGELEKATLRAARCALEVKSTLAGYEASGDVVLGIKMGIGAGQITAMTLGGLHGRWEYVVTGSPLAQMASAEKIAASGDVILSKEAAEIVQGSCTGRTLDGGLLMVSEITRPEPVTPLPPPGLPLTAESEEAILQFVPRAIRARLLAGQLDSLAELRRVSVLFVNIRGLDLPADEIFEAAQAGTLATQRALFHYEGSLNKLLVDDKGCSLIVAFGLPPFAHEDDPLRACRSAKEMRIGLQSLGLECSIGIATGKVFAGPLGSNACREFAIMGDTVNVAARLMQTAWGPGGEGAAGDDHILCDESTWRAADEKLEFERLEPIKLKGKAGLIPIFRPGAEMRASDLKSLAKELVGGQAVQAGLTGRLDQLLAGQGSVVLVEGITGIGKSIHVRTLEERARLGGVRIVPGIAEAIEARTPYFVWKSVLRQLIGLAASSSGDEIEDSRSVVDYLRGIGMEPDLAPLLNPVAGLKLPETGITEGLSGKARAERTHAFIAGILRAAAGLSPVMIVLENAQWLDSASWAQVLEISASVDRLMLVIVTRPGLDSEDFRRLLKAPVTSKILLGNLPRADMIGVVARELGVDTLAESLASLIWSRADGHPGFSIQLAQALRARGIVACEDGEARLTRSDSEMSTLDIATDLRGAITSRIDRLKPELASMLKTASVAGRTFNEGLLLALMPVGDAESLRDCLATLHEIDLLERPDGDPGASWAFTNTLTQEVIYELLLFSQRRELHARTARWLEDAKNAKNVEPAVLAHHYLAAAGENEIEPGLGFKAIEYLRLAAKRSAESFANTEAIHQCEQAIEVISKLPETPELCQTEFELQLSLVPMLMATKGFAVHEVGYALERAHELCLEHAGDDSLKVHSVTRGRWQYHLVRGELDQAKELSLELVENAKRDSGHSLLPESYRALGESTMFTGRFDEARDAFEKGIEFHDETAFSTAESPLVLCLYHLAWTRWFLGEPDKAREAATASESAAKQLGDPFSLAVAKYGHLVTRACLREYESVIPLAEEMRQLCIEREFGMLVGVAAIPLGWALTMQGEHERGLAEIQGGIAICEATGTHLQMTMFKTFFADALARVGQHSKALAIIDSALQMVTRNNERWWQAELERLEGESRLALRPTADNKAEQCFRRAIDTARAQHARSWELRATMSLARLLASRGEAAKAREALSPIHAAFTEGLDTADLKEATLLLAELS